MLMVRVEHMASECTLIRNDLDKIGGRLSETEGRTGTVKDQQRVSSCTNCRSAVAGEFASP